MYHKMSSESAIIGNINAMVLQDNKAIPTHPAEYRDAPVEQLSGKEGFDILADLPTNSQQTQHCEPHKIETALAPSAAKAVEFSSSVLSAVEVGPIVHKTLLEGAVSENFSKATPTPALGLLQAGKLAAAVVPAALPVLALPPAEVAIQGIANIDPAAATIPDHAPVPQHQLEPQEPFADEGPSRKRLSCSPATAFQRFGDNSIYTTEVSELNIWDLKPLSSSVPNFISQGIPLVTNYSPECFVIANNQISICSHILPVATQNSRFPAGVNISTLVFDMHKAPIAPANARFCTVEWLAPIRKGFCTPSDHAPFMNDKLLSKFYVADMLRVYLRPANHNLVHDAAHLFGNQLIFHDNRSMYAKLISQSLAIEIATAQGCQCTAEAWPTANYVSYINLDDPALGAASLANLFYSGSIVFIEGSDWSEDDLLVTHWLATPGFRVNGANDQVTSYAGYVSWPSVPITILRHGPALNRPAKALPTAVAIVSFAEKIARQRHELDDLATGIYIAMELVGVRYIMVNNHAYPCTSNHNAANILLPKPTEHNFMLRAAELFPKMDETCLREVKSFIFTQGFLRVRLCALYNACIGSFTTTLLFGLSIVTEDITMWGVGGNQASFVNSILRHGICIPLSRPGGEAAPFFIPKLAIKQYMGLVPMIGQFQGSTWNGREGQTADIANCFDGMPATNTIRWQSVLGIDNFLLERPREWAILGPHTKIDLRSELVVDSCGVRCYKGESLYSERSKSSLPFLFVPYGNQVVNAIHQYFQLPQAHVHFNAAHCNFGTGGQWKVATPYEALSYINGLHIFEPCVMGTFLFQSSEMRAPAMINNDLTLDQRQRLAALKGSEVDYVGFIRVRTPYVFTPLEPPPIAAFAALGMFGTRTSGHDAQPASSKRH